MPTATTDTKKTYAETTVPATTTPETPIKRASVATSHPLFLTKESRDPKSRTPPPDSSTNDDEEDDDNEDPIIDPDDHTKPAAKKLQTTKEKAVSIRTPTMRPQLTIIPISRRIAMVDIPHLTDIPEPNDWMDLLGDLNALPTFPTAEHNA